MWYVANNEKMILDSQTSLITNSSSELFTWAKSEKSFREFLDKIITHLGFPSLGIYEIFIIPNSYFEYSDINRDILNCFVDTDRKANFEVRNEIIGKIVNGDMMASHLLSVSSYSSAPTSNDYLVKVGDTLIETDFSCPFFDEALTAFLTSFLPCFGIPSETIKGIIIRRFPHDSEYLWNISHNDTKRIAEIIGFSLRNENPFSISEDYEDLHLAIREWLRNNEDRELLELVMENEPLEAAEIDFHGRKLMVFPADLYVRIDVSNDY